MPLRRTRRRVLHIARLYPRPYLNLARTSPVGGASFDFARTWYSDTESGNEYPTHTQIFARILKRVQPGTRYTTFSPDSSSGSDVLSMWTPWTRPSSARTSLRLTFPLLGCRAPAPPHAQRTPTLPTPTSHSTPSPQEPKASTKTQTASWAPSPSFPPLFCFFLLFTERRDNPHAQCESIVNIVPAASSRPRSRSCSCSCSWLAEEGPGPGATELEIDADREIPRPRRRNPSPKPRSRSRNSPRQLLRVLVPRTLLR
ncbi:hypothetical protein B0H13DRAFT_1022877 [Mycena leptocephala]|nr:hypothetical protein B0H13DRAFT_1022877 [Mycena leptocephala]